MKRDRHYIAKRCSIKKGFTLPELMVVILIIGLIAATVGIRFTGVTQNAKLEWAVSQIKAADDQLRTFAARDGATGILKIDLNKNQLTRVYKGTDKQEQAINIGGAIKINRFLSRTRDIKFNEAQVHYSQGGITESFALELSLPSGKSVWLFVAGLTGKITEQEEMADVQKIFSSLP